MTTNRFKASFQRIIWTIQTAKDLKSSQIAARLLFKGKRLIRRLIRARIPGFKFFFQPVLLTSNGLKGEAAEIIRRADRVLEHEYRFLNQTLKFTDGIDWQCPQVSRLWRFNLHYHAFIKDLADAFVLTGQPQYLDQMKQQMDSWMRGNRLPNGDGWHSYTVSLRVCNWIWAVSKCWHELENDREFCEGLLGNLWWQLRFLQRNLEFDTRGNHLLENIKALICGGIFFGRGNRGRQFYRQGFKIFAGQLAEQILADGGHCERSPMYHCIVLEDLLDLLAAFRIDNLDPPATLEPIIRKMLVFLKTMLFNDGLYPLFNDSAFDIALPPGFLIRWGDSVTGQTGDLHGSRQLQDSGYIRLNSDTGGTLLFNCGAPCPPFLPGHAHADTLGFEWAFDNGTRVFIDSGVYEYETGLWREYFRGTAAHNTVQIDDRNSSEVWGSFRTARKARVFHSGLTEAEGYVYAFAEHDGYSFLPGKPLHRREIFLFDRNVLLVIDTICGSGTHYIASNLHLHSDWSTQIIHGRDDQILDFSGPHQELQLQFLGEGRVSVHRGDHHPILGWYSPAFYQKVPIFSVIYHTQVKLPFRTGFICHDRNSNISRSRSGNQIHFKINGISIDLNMDPYCNAATI